MDGMRHNGCKRAAWPSSNCRTGPRTTNLPRLGRCRVEVASQAPTSQALMASAQPSAQPAVAAAVAAARQDRLHVARSQARRPPESARHQRRPNAEQRRPCSNQGRPRACPPLSASHEATPCGVMPPRQRKTSVTEHAVRLLGMLPARRQACLLVRRQTGLAHPRRRRLTGCLRSSPDSDLVSGEGAGADMGALCAAGALLQPRSGRTWTAGLYV